MRDYFLLAVLPILIYAMAKRPFIALGLWVWTALFFPNGWVYGPATVVRFNLLFAAITIGGFIMWRPKPKFHLTGTGGLIIAFLLWTTLSSITSIGIPEVTWEFWSRFLKVVILFLFVLLIVEKKLHVDFLLWCVVLSVGFYANLEALKYLASGGSHKIAGMAGHVLGDRNELAIAFVMTLPIAYYLLVEYGRKSRILWIGLVATMSLLTAGVIGTQSRGGFISLLSLACYLFIKSKRKLPIAALFLVLGIGLSYVVSSEFTSRIDTINNANQDASFMGRVVAWKLSFIMATHNPLFGGGFKSLEYFPNWARLSSEFASYPWFYTSDAYPDTMHPHAAHSVYFQVLGDHGFAGLGIYLAFLIGAFRKAGQVARQAAYAPEWIQTLASMLQLSIFVFALGGAALSFAYFDLTFALIGLIVVLEKRILPAALREPTS